MYIYLYKVGPLTSSSRRLLRTTLKGPQSSANSPSSCGERHEMGGSSCGDTCTAVLTCTAGLSYSTAAAYLAAHSCLQLVGFLLACWCPRCGAHTGAALKCFRKFHLGTQSNALVFVRAGDIRGDVLGL